MILNYSIQQNVDNSRRSKEVEKSCNLIDIKEFTTP